jgi:hypothetical protein
VVNVVLISRLNKKKTVLTAKACLIIYCSYSKFTTHGPAQTNLTNTPTFSTGAFDPCGEVEEGSAKLPALP